MTERAGNADSTYCGRYTWCYWCPAPHVKPPAGFTYADTSKACTCTQHGEKKK